MSRYVIFDLDGCISDDRERLPLIDHSKDDPWKEYHDKCHCDPLINGHLVSIGKHLAVPIIFTLRPESVRRKTEWWLKNVAGMPTEFLFMRKEDEHCTPSVELKENYLRKLEQAFHPAPLEIVLALDDQRDILDMYESFGIKTIQTFYPEGVTI